MEFTIYKYHGCGNDFLLIDNREINHSFTPSEIVKLTDRRFGIGADGLIAPNSSIEHAFEMEFHNSDGTRGVMCGNGGRSIVAFAEQLGIKGNIAPNIYTFLAAGEVHRGEIFSKKNGIYDIKITMTDVESVREHSPKSFFLNTGSPHFVIFVDNLDRYSVEKEGKRWRHNALFKGGTNVNFVEGEWIKDGKKWGRESSNRATFTINSRTYERGVEGETLACGTGAVASSIAYHKLLNNNLISRYGGGEPVPFEVNSTIKVLGGTLQVSFRYLGNNRYDQITLRGEATFLFKCQFTI